MRGEGREGEGRGGEGRGGEGRGGRGLRIIQSHQAINIKDGNVRSIFSYVFLR